MNHDLLSQNSELNVKKGWKSRIGALTTFVKRIGMPLLAKMDGRWTYDPRGQNYWVALNFSFFVRKNHRIRAKGIEL